MTRSPDQATGTRTPGTTTRERLMAAAAELVAERGWGAVTTRAVAERAGVNNALVHYHFGSVDALLTAALIAAWQEVGRDGLGRLLEAADLPAGLVSYAGWLCERPDDPIVNRLLVEGLGQATLNPEIAAHLREGLLAVRAELQRRLDELVDEGRLPPATDTLALAAVVAAVCDGLPIHLLIDPDLGAPRTFQAFAALLDSHQEDHR